jgi:type II secretory pathway component GspD/PulD (secretin)
MKAPLILLCALLLPVAAEAQTAHPATPPPLEPTPSAPTAAATPAASATPFNPSLPQSTVSSLPSEPAAATAAAGKEPENSIRLNFKNASLADVLSYLSSAAGFIILQEAPVAGTVSVVSAQPVTADEAVDLLNAVLVEKGFIAMRSGRILKIVSRQDAEKRDLPVMTGSNPAEIPRKDNLVTQILPVRYADVTKLIDNISPLLPTTAQITSNASSNAIVLTDTQTDIHRIAEIIRALDTSISGISTIHVYPLRYGDAKTLADVLTQLFSPNQSGQNTNPFANLPFFMRGGGGGGRGGGGGGNGGGTPAQPESEARQAASRVVAVPDDSSNSVIVSAPEEYLPTITGIVNQLDMPQSDITETHIFALQHADATELAGILSTLFGATTSTPGAASSTNNNSNQRGGNNQGQRPPQQNNQNQPGGERSERALLQSQVAVVADARTNSVLVQASHDTMAQIEMTIARLDASGAKKQHVHVYTLNHADPDNVAAIVKGMFTVEQTNASTSIQPSLSRLTNRTTTGASSDISDTLNTSSNSGTSR